MSRKLHQPVLMSRAPAPAGAAAIAKSLALAPKLRFLDLSRCNIGTDGLAALTEALRQGGALQVCLSETGDVAVMALCCL